MPVTASFISFNIGYAANNSGCSITSSSLASCFNASRYHCFAGFIFDLLSSISHFHVSVLFLSAGVLSQPVFSQTSLGLTPSLSIFCASESFPSGAPKAFLPAISKRASDIASDSFSITFCFAIIPVSALRITPLAVV